MSVEFVPEVVWTGILEDVVTFVRFKLNYKKKSPFFIEKILVYDNFELKFL